MSVYEVYYNHMLYNLIAYLLTHLLANFLVNKKQTVSKIVMSKQMLQYCYSVH